MSTRNASMDSLKDAQITGFWSASLAVRGDLKMAYMLSCLLALMMALAAFTGILFRNAIYPTDELILAFFPVDLFHLVVGMPILLGSMWLAHRGKLLGLLCWPGALLYVLYSYVMNLVGLPFGVLFLPHLLLVTLSAYAIVAIMSKVDCEAVRGRLTGAVPAKAAGGVLVGLTGFFLLHAVAGIFTALMNQVEVGPLDLMLWIADLAVLVPACLGGGILLLQRKTLGYAGAAGLLLAYSMLFFGLMPVMLFPAIQDGSPVDVAGIVMMLASGLICLTLLLLFLRGIVRSGGSFGGDIG